jgi:CxxC motif-containing protein (DUF1111 family)
VRRLALALAALLSAGCGPDEPVAPTAEAEAEAAAARELVIVREDPSDAPLAGLPDDQRARFEAGDARFELPFREPQGLGPLYIHRSCSTCHEDDARGPGAVRRLVFDGEGAPEEALPHGDVVRPRLAAGASTPLVPPARDDVHEEVRLGPAVFGRGYLEAIPDTTLRAWAAEQRGRDDGISGRVHVVPRASAVPLDEGLPQLGRFGLKARIASLEEFVADALLSDMGLTSPLRPEEPANPDGLTDDEREGVDVSREEVRLLADYVRLLALPRRTLPDGPGAALFEEARCAVCHVPVARTAPNAPLAALRDVEARIYTDLLLHDMGEGLADGVVEHGASGREWRTAPLIGIRFLRGLLHDGRAETVREAIELHASAGSEANDSVARFEAMAPAAQEHLIAFVEAL